jgi:hypothetical protein
VAAVAIVAFLAVVVIVLVVGGMVTAQRSAGQAIRPVEASTDQDLLRYPVPTGIDAAVVVGALRRDGFQASTELDANQQPIVLVTGESGSLDREKIRASLRAVPFREGEQPAGLADIRFADE